MSGELKKRYYFLIVFLLISLFIPLLYKANIVNHDSEMIIRPLIGINSIQDYINQRLQNNIFDVAPVRDFSHFIDIKLFNSSSFNLDIVHNLILWFCILILVKLILKEWKVSKTTIFLVVLLLSLHPSLLQTIVWVSARKHILATMFLLMAIYYDLKNQSRENDLYRFAIYVSYLLSALSWPILILFPIYYLIFGQSFLSCHKKEKLLIVSLFLTMLIILYFNISFYQNQFTALLGVEKTESKISIGLSLLGLGRSFIQTIFPFSIAIAYGPNSILNIIGLILFPITNYILYANLAKKDFYKYLVLYLLPLVTVLTFPTAIFLMDCYVFFSVIVFWMFFFKSVDVYLAKYLKSTYLILAILVCFFYYKDFFEFNLRLNEHAYIENSFQVDKNCVSYGAHILQVWEDGNINESILEFKKFTELGCRKSNMQQIYLYTIFQDDQFSIQEKKNILSVHAKNSFLANILLLGLEHKLDPNQVIKNLNNLFRNNLGKTIRVPFDKRQDPLLKNLIEKCEINLKFESNNTDCREFLLNLDKHILKH